MSERPSKERIRQIHREMAERARSESLAALPADADELERLFSRLAELVEQSGCNHSLRSARIAIAELGLNESTVVAWFNGSGGYCDCEVLMNVEPGWRELVKR